MPFFDFHCHPGLKPQFSKPSDKPSPWEFIDAKLAVFADVKISINKLFNEVLNSQSNLTQLTEAGVKLIGVILHAPEQKIGQVLSEKKIVNWGTVNLINKDQLQYLKSGIHNYELINTELNWLLNAPSPAGRSFKLLNKTTDFKENSTNTVYGVIIVEGLHCFFNNPDSLTAKEEFTQNFIEFTNTHTVLAINVCHMQQNLFCNHAHGIQLFNPAYFFPLSTGISLWGKEVMQMMIDRNILIDIKHMSLKSRIDLYLWFNETGDENFIQPIICTHAGMTGISINERAKYINQKPADKGSVYEVVYRKPKSKHNDETYYNCSSINLYDEDIAYILRSGGIIGLSFDQRILGFADENVLHTVNTPHDVEYISHMEAGFFFGPNMDALPIWPGDEGVWSSEDFEDTEPASYVDLHRKFLINNIIHILWVAANHPGIDIKKAAKQICIGTDFDGLINAIDCCKDCTDLLQLKEDMTDEMLNMLEANGLDGELNNVNSLLDDIFYNNGKNFVLNRIRIIAGV